MVFCLFLFSPVCLLFLFSFVDCFGEVLFCIPLFLLGFVLFWVFCLFLFVCLGVFCFCLVCLNVCLFGLFFVYLGRGNINSLILIFDLTVILYTAFCFECVCMCVRACFVFVSGHYHRRRHHHLNQLYQSWPEIDLVLYQYTIF